MNRHAGMSLAGIHRLYGHYSDNLYVSEIWILASVIAPALP